MTALIIGFENKKERTEEIKTVKIESTEPITDYGRMMINNLCIHYL